MSVDPRQTIGGDHAVFVDQRHQIGDGTQCGQVDQRQCGFISAQRAHQLERHARAAQRRERIVVQQRIDGGAVGQRLRRPVVIGDHAVHAQMLRQIDQRAVGDAAVHRHQQAAALRDSADGCLVQAVSLRVAIRQIDIHVCIQAAQMGVQNGGGGDAVHVVIAIDGDGGASCQVISNAIHGGAHVAEQIRVSQVVQRRMQKALRFLRRFDAAGEQDLVYQRIHVIGALKARHGSGIAGNHPAHEITSNALV